MVIKYCTLESPLLLWDKSRLSLHRRTADVFNSEHGVESGTKNHLVGFTGVIDLALTESRMFGNEVGIHRVSQVRHGTCSFTWPLIPESWRSF